MAMEPPRTRSRSRSGFYQQYGATGPGINANGGNGPNHHHHHSQQQHHHQQQQHNSGCSPLGAHGHHTEQHSIRALGSNVSPRQSGPPGAHRISPAGAVGGRSHPDHACGEGDKNEDSPSPKRQRLSGQSVLDLSTVAPPSNPSPPMRPWELPHSRRPPPNPHPHYHQERCHTPVRHRHSPPARRPRGRLSRTPRHLPPPPPPPHHPSPPPPPSDWTPGPKGLSPPSSPYGQPQPLPVGAWRSLLTGSTPALSPRLLHPAVHHSHQAAHHHTQQQGAMVMDLHEQASVPVSYTVTPVPSHHGLVAPLYTGQHLPPVCSSQQQIPACSVVFSTGQHYHPMLGACSVQHLPVPYSFPSLLSNDPPFLLPPPHLSHHPPHLPPPGHFLPFPTQQSRSPLQRIENEVELLGEHLSVGGGFNYPHGHHPSSLPPSTPLQFLSHHDSLSQELFGVPYPHFMPRRITGRRYRSQQTVPPPPYHPGFLPYFL
ncbi:E3 ubiquitin-protein ligase RNF38-like [Oncorhynchus keta]|uniref:E3 ubiquitin-protein ligase RNF38-like n=1 Tax=Oncorhynchus keta TaxID=8018 RepID=UPI00227CF712|nr:E3 ubiquitin-protein ligase RNF38-like [Oncorhynchus keta]